MELYQEGRSAGSDDLEGSPADFAEKSAVSNRHGVPGVSTNCSVDGPWLSMSRVRLLLSMLCLVAALAHCSDNSPPSSDKASTPAPGEDNTEMILVPAGEFVMGNEGEKTAHPVYVNAYYIDRYSVTNAKYERFMKSAGRRAPLHWTDVRFNQPSHPVVGISWDDATAYAKWAGKRLPTEAEWEKAARGRLMGKKYPWAGELPDKELANFGGNVGGTTPVGEYLPNGFGLYDMAGNVFNLCSDRYQWDYYRSSPRKNPKGPGTGEYRVARGGSWRSSEFYLRCSSRYDVHYVTRSHVDVGFRCAKDSAKR